MAELLAGFQQKYSNRTEAQWQHCCHSHGPGSLDEHSSKTCVFESNNVVNNALQWAIHDWLGSTVYYALNYTIGYLDGLEEESVSRDKLNGLDYLLGLRGLYERFDFVLSANSS